MTISASKVCVVVPVYRADLSLPEQAALDRCIAVLGSHPIVVVKPESLRLDALFSRHPSLLSENFRDDFFADVKGYNRLLLWMSFTLVFPPMSSC